MSVTACSAAGWRSPRLLRRTSKRRSTTLNFRQILLELSRHEPLPANPKRIPRTRDQVAVVDRPTQSTAGAPGAKHITLTHSHPVPNLVVKHWSKVVGFVAIHAAPTFTFRLASVLPQAHPENLLASLQPCCHHAGRRRERHHRRQTRPRLHRAQHDLDDSEVGLCPRCCLRRSSLRKAFQSLAGCSSASGVAK